MVYSDLDARPAKAKGMSKVTTETVLSELNSILSLLEARIPGSAADPGNQRLVNSLQADISEYFRQVEMALPLADIETLYYNRVGIAESDRPVKVVFEEPLEPILEPIVIQGLPGEQGPQGPPGIDGRDGKDGRDGADGADGKDGLSIKGRDGVDGKDGLNGRDGIDGRDGRSIKGERGEAGEPGKAGISRDEHKAVKNLISDFSGKTFVEDDDPRLKDDRSPKSHKHPEIQSIVMSYPIANIGSLGIGSEPPSGFKKVSNIYVEPETGKLIVIHEL